MSRKKTEIRGETLLEDIERILPTTTGRVAAITCDIEPDFGNRTNSEELLTHRRHLDQLHQLLASHETPLSVFVVTRCLRHDSLVQTIIEHQLDAHAHSHNHDMASYQTNTRQEIHTSQEAFVSCFGRPALGYRAPQGVLLPNDPEEIAQAGFAFSSSVFPSRRRGLFDYRALPQTP
ncbi:MAG: polysaccharide deacetylase family protein, partial [Proteobacteria bacterium]|nr:polysaccharide deacetylase family protein [Pseudomonadota bacterium]